VVVELLTRQAIAVAEQQVKEWLVQVVKGFPLGNNLADILMGVLTGSLLM